MVYEYRAKIYGYDCDIYGHLNNANYQNIYEAARSEMLDELGLPLSLLLSEGIHIYVRKITIEYLKGVTFGSEVTVRSRIGSLSRVKSVWYQEIYSSEDDLLNKAMVEGVFTKNGKPFRIPAEMERKLQQQTY